MIGRRLLALLILFFLVMLTLALLGIFSPVSLLPESVATSLNLPEVIADPRLVLTSVPTLINEPQQQTPVIVIQGTPYESPTPAPSPTPTPEPVLNGRLLYLGLDEKVYSIGEDGGSPTLLGGGADFHVFPGIPWYSPDGSYALVVGSRDGGATLELIPVDGSAPASPAGVYAPASQKGLPRQFFEFSPDGQRFLWVENADQGAILSVLDLRSGTRWGLPVKIERSVVNQATFYQDSDHILLADRDPQGGQPYLSVYRIEGNAIVEVERIAEFPGWVLDQFSPSPDGRRVAVVLRDPANTRAVYLVDRQNNEVQPVLSGSDLEVYLAPPSWTPDSAWLLVNQWGLNHQLLAYNVGGRNLIPLLSNEMDAGTGSPLAVVKTFSPDSKAAGLVLYADGLTWESFWLVVLDGSYVKKITQADREDATRAGEYITGITPDWIYSFVVVIEPGLPVGTLYRADLDGGQRVVLDNFVPAQFNNLGPAVSPDGRKVAYFRLSPDSGAAGPGELCVIGIDGGQIQIWVAGGGPGNETMPGIPLIWLPKSIQK